MSGVDYQAYPPIVWRAIAKEGKRLLGPDEIARRSGLSRSTVQRVSAQGWDNVRVGVMNRFVKGCIGEVSAGEVRNRLKELERNGLSGVRWLSVRKNDPLWRRGATGNTLKFMMRVISEQF